MVAVTLDIFQDQPGPVAVDILDSFANRKSMFGGVLRPYPQRQVAPVIFHPINGQPFGQSSQSFTGEQRVPMKSVAEFYMGIGIVALKPGKRLIRERAAVNALLGGHELDSVSAERGRLVTRARRSAASAAVQEMLRPTQIGRANV